MEPREGKETTRETARKEAQENKLKMWKDKIRRYQIPGDFHRPNKRFKLPAKDRLNQKEKKTLR